MQIPAICAIGMALPWKGLMFLQNYAGVPTHRKRLRPAERVETESAPVDRPSGIVTLYSRWLDHKALSR